MSGNVGGKALVAPIWLVDLDDTLHDASREITGEIEVAMINFVGRHFGLNKTDACEFRRLLIARHGSTLAGLERLGVHPADFIRDAHELPGLEQRLQGGRGDGAILARLPGRKVLLTNGSRRYAIRVLKTLGLLPLFSRLISVENLRMLGRFRAKPDRHAFLRVAQSLQVAPQRCILVDDSLPNLKSARRLGMRTVWLRRFYVNAKRGASRRVEPVGAGIVVAQRLSDLRKVAMSAAFTSSARHGRNDRI